VQVLTLVMPDFQRAQPADWPWLEHWLLHELCSVVLPERQWRSNPRVVKRRASKFESKKPQQAPPPQPDKDTTLRDVIGLLPLHTAPSPSPPGGCFVSTRTRHSPYLNCIAIDRAHRRFIGPRPRPINRPLRSEMPLFQQCLCCLGQIVFSLRCATIGS
jgi:hypothetical protein